MAIFDRIRRSRAPRAGGAAPLAPVAAHLLPDINQRVTVTMGEHVPVASRVEDVVGTQVMLALPALPLDVDDPVVVTWEREGGWFSLDTRVQSVDEHAPVPTVSIAAGGRLSRYDERRTDSRRAVELPIELRVVRARALRPGRELRTTTVEVSANAIRFATSAPFAPGDLIEARVQLGEGVRDVVATRIRVIRIDAVTGSWRSTCTATFDEVLRSDRERIIAVANASGTAVQDGPSLEVDGQLPATPPTADGVGGRDEPDTANSIAAAVEWLNRRG
ncbi:MAG: hypothetical protein JWM98_2372 [Thermoleophilia bacterium]|nr:hypothetical protein [Thermoleophilia bacterium]